MSAKLTWPCPGYGISVVDGELQDSDAHVARGGGEAIDIGAPHRTDCLALCDARWKGEGFLPDAGYYLDLEWDDDDGHYVARYCHLAEYAWPPEGTSMVSAGQFVGFVGASGHAQGAHLHLWIERNGARVRPEDYLTMEADPMRRTEQQERLIQNQRNREAYLRQLSGELRDLQHHNYAEALGALANDCKADGDALEFTEFPEIP